MAVGCNSRRKGVSPSHWRKCVAWQPARGTQWLRNSGGTVLNSHTYLHDQGNRRTNTVRVDGSKVSYGYPPSWRPVVRAHRR